MSNSQGSFLRYLNSSSDKLFAATVAFTFGASFLSILDGSASLCFAQKISRICLGISALFFVLDDWLSSRRISRALAIPNDKNYGRRDVFFASLDFVIAILAFPFILSAFWANRIFGLIFATILFVGALWAVIGYSREYYKNQYERINKRLQFCLLAIAIIQSFGCALIIGAYGVTIWDSDERWFTWIFRPMDEERIVVYALMVFFVLLTNRFVSRTSMWTICRDGYVWTLKRPKDLKGVT